MVEVCGDLTLLYAGGSLLVYDHSASESRVVKVLPESASDDSNNIRQPEDTEEEETKNGKEMGDKEENEGEKNNRGKVGKDDGRKKTDVGHKENGKTLSHNNNNKNNSDPESQRITAAKFTPDGHWVVVGGGWKAVEVWSTADWQRKATHRLAKKPTALAVTPDSGCVLVADRTGDVYQFPLLQSEPTTTTTTTTTTNDRPQPILGHLSMLLDVAVTPDARYILSCDRDEKVRVTHLAHPYLIHTFCLGHREFVTRLSVLSSRPPRLLSSSGDGFIKLWDYEEGRCLSEVNISPLISPFLLPSQPGGEEEGAGGEGEGHSTPPPLPTTLTTAVPAVKNISVISDSTSSTHLVAVLVNRAKAVVLCQVVEDSTLHHLSTTELPAPPAAASWRRSRGGGEQLIILVEDCGCGEGPVMLMERGGVALKVVEEVKGSGLVSLGRKHRDWLRGPSSSSSSLGFLYKQKFDNVAEYLRKKKERVELQESGQPLPKIGRWVK